MSETGDVSSANSHGCSVSQTGDVSSANSHGCPVRRLVLKGQHWVKVRWVQACMGRMVCLCT